MSTIATNGSVIQLHDVTNGNVRHLPVLLKMMPHFFPGLEKFLPWLEHNAVTRLGNNPHVIPHQWVVEVDGETAGFYVFDYRPERDSGLSLFMGLYPQYRGLAVNSFERLARFLFVESVRTVVADAERLKRRPPPGLAGEIELQPLLQRYLAYDFVVLPVVYYEPMFPSHWTTMSLDVNPDTIGYERVPLGMFHDPAAPKRPLTAAQVANQALAYLVDFYRLPLDSMPVRQALATAQPFEWK